MNEAPALAVCLAANVAVIVWAYRRRDWQDGLDWHDDIDDTATPAVYDPAMSDTPTTPDPVDPDAPVDPDDPDDADS